MTGYWAHYTTSFKNADGTWGSSGVDTFPVVGYTDVALVIDEDGTVKRVHVLLDELRQGGCVPDEEGQIVSLAVNTYNGGE
jgi:hypothetical protein